MRLFNGFYEGCPQLVVDCYGETLILYNYANQPEELHPLLADLKTWLCSKIPNVHALLLKERNALDLSARNGQLVFGDSLTSSICEFGVCYALQLCMNQDASFYLDTRAVRTWLRTHSTNSLVLNTFAYTGSLGAAALAGGAQRVVQTDRTARFLAIAQDTCRLNQWPVSNEDFLVSDFFRMTAELKKAGSLFDCVILDPPFFSDSPSGKIDWAAESQALINKVRPLVAHNGHLIVINNALFLSGKNYLDTLETLCSSGYMQIEAILPVPEDVTGFSSTRLITPPADPAPYNHPTKITTSKVLRKDQAPARVLEPTRNLQSGSIPDRSIPRLHQHFNGLQYGGLFDQNVIRLKG